VQAQDFDGAQRLRPAIGLDRTVEHGACLGLGTLGHRFRIVRYDPQYGTPDRRPYDPNYGAYEDDYYGDDSGLYGGPGYRQSTYRQECRPSEIVTYDRRGRERREEVMMCRGRDGVWRQE
jgi:hypothetical protein